MKKSQSRCSPSSQQRKISQEEGKGYNIIAVHVYMRSYHMVSIPCY